ncbi:MAG: ABC transporter ATP-binding protein [Gaiella sp.]|nr:ABC transporter ATP-binding protein [Gaiella sp.]
MPGDHAVEVDRLHVVRGGRDALDRITLGVRGGTVTGLLGPSGSGKSTLMRAIVGTQVVVSGSVTVLGEPAGTAGLRRRIAYTTQSPAVYDDLTVRENVRYFARVVGAPNARVDETIELVGLGEEAGRVVGRLSGGQHARVSLATALVGRPELLVLDEPTVGLDPVLRRDLWGTFARLAAEGATLLVSSHVMDEAEHCDDLLLLRGGRLLAQGTTGEIRERAGAADLDEAFLRLVTEAARR